MCGLQFSVQLSQSVQLTCERVDTDGTVPLQDGVPEQKGLDGSNEHVTGLGALLVVLGGMCAAYRMVLLALSGSLALMVPMLFTNISSFTLKV